MLTTLNTIMLQVMPVLASGGLTTENLKGWILGLALPVVVVSGIVSMGYFLIKKKYREAIIAFIVAALIGAGMVLLDSQVGEGTLVTNTTGEFIEKLGGKSGN